MSTAFDTKIARIHELNRRQDQEFTELQNIHRLYSEAMRLATAAGEDPATDQNVIAIARVEQLIKQHLQEDYDEEFDLRTTVLHG